MTQYLTRYLATNDTKSLNRTASTGVVALACCGVFVFIVSIVLALNLSNFFQIPQNSITEAALVIVITGASVAVQFLLMTYSAVFTAVQRFDLSNGIGIATRLLSVVVTVWSLKLGYGLVGLSIATAGTNIIDYLIRWRVSARLLPSMRISPKLATGQKLGELSKFGLWNTAIAGSVHLISYTDSVVIAAFMPVSAVAPFAIAASLRSYFDDIFRRVGYVFFPVATELDAQGNHEGLRKLYLVSSKFMFLGSILCGSMAIFWARDFFRLWLGAAFAEAAGYPSIATLFYLLVFGSIVSVAQRIGYQVLLGRRQVGLLASLFAAEGVCNFVLSIILVRAYGLTGVAIGTLVPAVVFQGVLQPLIVCRSLEISLNVYCKEVLLRPILVLLPLLAVLYAFLSLQQPDNWLTLFFLSSITLAAAIPFVLLIGLNKSERDLLLVRPTTEALRYLGAVGLTRS
jgi:O-antigen/teichoic acid export membrane protein